jgi:hypothetical protein
MIKLHNIPKAVTEDKVTNVIIEHGMARLVFTRIEHTDIIQVSITPNLERERKVISSFLNLEELDTVFQNLDLVEAVNEFD